MNPDEVKTVVVLENIDFSAAIAENAAFIKERFQGRAKTIGLRTDRPLYVADTLKQELLPLLDACEGLCLIDVTTLTHEEVLIMVRLLADRAPSGRIVLAYTGAEEYSVNTDPKEKWLSKGVRDARPVLGYPGTMLPSQKLHLIILVGFEHERAQDLIQRYEPALVSLGLGQKEESLSVAHHLKNAEFHERVRDFAQDVTASTASVHTFEFSCIDPVAAARSIGSESQRFSGYNVAVCPMNTKPSTIGCALAAIENQSIQLVYVQPVEYNTLGYSTPGKTCTLFEFSSYLLARINPVQASLED
jgi:hypothetical protein